MSSTTSNCFTIPKGVMVTTVTCRRSTSRGTILRSSRVSRKMGAIHSYQITYLSKTQNREEKSQPTRRHQRGCSFQGFPCCPSERIKLLLMACLSRIYFNPSYRTCPTRVNHALPNFIRKLMGWLYSSLGKSSISLKKSPSDPSVAKAPLSRHFLDCCLVVL